MKGSQLLLVIIGVLSNSISPSTMEDQWLDSELPPWENQARYPTTPRSVPRSHHEATVERPAPTGTCDGQHAILRIVIWPITVLLLGISLLISIAIYTKTRVQRRPIHRQQNPIVQDNIPLVNINQ
jgi:hypothetical protein